MEEEADDQQLSLFWLDNTANFRRGEICRRRLSSFLLSSGVLLALLLITGLLLLLISNPSILSFTSQLFRPNIEKRSWISVNFVLVLFALVFGLLCRRKKEDNTAFDEYHKISSYKSNTSNQLYDFSDRGYISSNRSSIGGLRRRANSSCPDLREVSSPWIAGGDNSRFYDDTKVDNYLASDSGQFHRRRICKKFQRREAEITNMHGDTLKDIPSEHSYARPPPSAPSSPPQPPPSATPQQVGQREDKAYVSYTQIPPESPSPPRPRSPESSLCVSSPTSSVSSEQPSLLDGGDSAATPLFWPSPDINAKADSFISKFRAALKLERPSPSHKSKG